MKSIILTKLAHLLAVSLMMMIANKSHANTIVYDKQRGIILMTDRIDIGEYESFQKAANEITKSGYKVSLVRADNLMGGLTAEALKIGQWIFSNKIEVEIIGHCHSSCANYIFLAGKRKTLNNALIGFHGSPTATKKTLSGKDADDEYISDEDFSILQKKYGFHSRDEIISGRKYVSSNEPYFFSNIGVDQEIFDATVNEIARKVLGCEDGSDLYLLGKDEFLKYRIPNVVGTLAVKWLKSNNPKNFCLAPSLKNDLMFD